MKSEQVQISGDQINRLIKLLSKIKNLDAKKTYSLENVAKLNGRAAILYSYFASLPIKQQAQINWMQQVLQFCQVYFQKWVIDNEIHSGEPHEILKVNQ